MKKLAIIFSLIFSFSQYAGAQSFSLNDSTFEAGDVLVTYRIVFDYDKATIQRVSIPFLDSLKAFLMANPSLRIEIGNHRETGFKNEYGLCLSCRRAEVIGNYLISQGIPKERLVCKGYNDSRPLIFPPADREEDLKNRRTEIRILATGQE